MKKTFAIAVILSTIMCGCVGDDRCDHLCKDADDKEHCVMVCETQRPEPGGKDGVGGK
jgi:hypothetical protein